MSWEGFNRSLNLQKGQMIHRGMGPVSELLASDMFSSLYNELRKYYCGKWDMFIDQLQTPENFKWVSHADL